VVIFAQEAVIWYVIIVYLAAMLFIGIYASRFIKSTSDFLLAGRRLGLILTAATLAATHYGGGFVLGGGSWGVKYGIGGFWYGFACGLGLLLLGLSFAKLSRALAVYTVPEILNLRYKSGAIQCLAALLSLLALIGIIGAQVWAAGAVFEAIGLPGLWGSVLATTIFIAYTAISGLWAVTLTDLVQILIGSGGVLLATGIALSVAGGIGGIISKLEKLADLPQPTSMYLNVGSPGASVILLTLIATVMYTLIGQDFYQRLFAAKTERIAVLAALTSGVFLMVISIVPPLAGMAALALSPNPLKVISSPRVAIPHLVLVMFGPIIGAIFIAAILAAIMSTADSLLTAATSHIIRDFYFRFINPRASDKYMLRLSIITTIAIGIFALIMALTVKGIIELLIYSYDIYTAGVFIPLVLGLLWKRATKEGALAGMISGTIVAILGITGIITFPYWEFIYVSGALVSLIVMIAVSLVTKPTIPEEMLAKVLGWTK